jgi:DNA topoisomerase-1
VKDRRLAGGVRRCLATPGRSVFKFVAEDGTVLARRRRHVNAYIKETMGPGFSAKDFRTWAGTTLCAAALVRVAADARTDDARVRERLIASAGRGTAERLGNTPAVCRGSYIAPVLFDEFRKGRLLGAASNGRARRWHADERALIALITNVRRRCPRGREYEKAARGRSVGR